LLPHELETDVLVDQPQQMVFRNLVFQPEIIEQRFCADVVPHHDQQASKDLKSSETWEGSSPSNMLLLNLSR
jgi:hypothetical protein